MGMDFNIYSARNHEVFKHNGWWDNPNVIQEFYARKAWHFPENCNFIPKDYKSGDFIEITVENVEEMIQIACKYKNYWGNYNDIPKLCELRDQMEYENALDEKPDKKYFLEYDW